MILINSKSRKKVSVGDIVSIAYGKQGILRSIVQPNQVKDGRILVDCGGVHQYWYPSAIGAEFVHSDKNLLHAVGKAKTLAKIRRNS